MKRLLLIATAVLALTSAASAASVELPKELVLHSGKSWCKEIEDDQDGRLTLRMTHDNGGKACNRNSFAIEKDGSFGWGKETGCRPLHVREFALHEWKVIARCTAPTPEVPHLFDKIGVFTFSLYENNVLLLRMPYKWFGVGQLLVPPGL
jgi:hypothetical protein